MAEEQAEYERQAAMLHQRQQQWARQKFANIIREYGRAEAANLQEHKKKALNDFKAEINSRLGSQMSELYRLEQNGTIYAANKIRKDELEFSYYIFAHYLHMNDSKLRFLDWYQLADIVDYIAKNTKSDDEFRIVLWGLFGASIPGEHYPLLTRFVHPKNIGLQDRYLNSGYEQEQIHHYLAGVTGDFNDSHLMNNWFFTTLQEGDELFRRYSWNQGDWLLFQHTQSHRDDFIHGNLHNDGRFTVAPNIRKILKSKIKNSLNEKRGYTSLS